MNRLVIKKDIKYFLYTQKMFLMHGLSYKSNILATVVSSWGWTFLTIFFISVIYSGFDSFYGWNYYEMLIILTMGQISFYLVYILTPGANSLLGASIQNGELDKYLLRPIKSTLAVFTADSNIITLTPGVLLQLTIFIYALSNNPISPSILQIILTIIMVIIGYFLSLCMLVIINCLSFFIPYSNEGLLTAYMEFQELQKYPSNIYPDYLKPIFMFLVPFGLTAYAPAYILVKGIDINLFLLQICSLIFLYILARYLWTKGLKGYTSVSG